MGRGALLSWVCACVFVGRSKILVSKPFKDYGPFPLTLRQARVTTSGNTVSWLYCTDDNVLHTQADDALSYALDSFLFVYLQLHQHRSSARLSSLMSLKPLWDTSYDLFLELWVNRNQWWRFKMELLIVKILATNFYKIGCRSSGDCETNSKLISQSDVRFGVLAFTVRQK